LNQKNKIGIFSLTITNQSMASAELGNKEWTRNKNENHVCE